MARSDLSAAEDGVVDQVQESSVDLDPPPRPLLQRKLRDIFLDVASAPPGQEGRSLARGCVKYIGASSAERGGAKRRGVFGQETDFLDQPARRFAAPRPDQGGEFATNRLTPSKTALQHV